ncbi:MULTISPECIES: hypothetical protein [unclassified Micromonospora]|uniref:hypothetical protein n=1 Tax=unclassified Micromonospora TaxID=2617518 RepID=UPI001C24DC18|nr:MULTISPECIES: hypothetical protein [unclassified Micromonospora]MBU8861321.1 hypothetical protein [Micromonospora sp. WMMB482]MDM4780876.1 hypothetical protein [Micromonospora sp. b486]
MTGFAEAVVRGRMSEVRSALAGLDEPARRALGDELVADVRRRRDAWWWRGEAATLAVAAVGTLSTSTKVAALLGRRSVWLAGVDAAPVVDVARERGVTWLADVAYKLADRLPRDRMVAGWRFVAGLLLAEKAPPPTADDFVHGWAAAQGWPDPRGTRPPTVDRLRADPFLDALLPRLFEVDGVGTELARGDGTGTEAVPRALVALAAEGRLDRAVLLNGVLGRLLRGDRPGALRPFLVLHDLLAPTPDEVAVRSSAYLRLLADGPGPVARTAQRTLRQAGDVAEPEALWEAARTVLARPEKALVRAQVSWLDRLARQHPDRAPEIGAVLAAAAAHPDAGLRERALTLARRHGHRPVAVATVAEARDDLPPPLPAAAAPPQIAEVDELVEEVAAALRGQWPTAVLERVVDGLVRVGTRERDRVAAALAPVLRRAGVAEYHETWARFLPGAQMNGLLLAAAGIGDATRRRDNWASVLATSRSAQATSGRPAPTWLYRLRLAEAGQRLDGHDDPGLLSAPTSTSGAIEPAVLYERLAALGDRGHWQWDCAQAFLRLPAVVDEPLAARAQALGTAAGIELAAWLRGEAVPVPVQEVVTVGRRERSRAYDWSYDSLPERRRLVALTPPAGVDDRFGLLTLAPPAIGTRMFGTVGLWPAVLPGHRGVVAAQVLPELAMAAQEDLGGRGPVLLALAECTGAGGPALDLAVAYGLCARHEADRVAALDALLILAAAGDMDAPRVGGHLGEMGAQGQVTLTRAVTPLRDAVAAGAPLSVWRLLAGALPPLLAAPAPPRGTPDLLALAAETATATGVRIEVPGLADVVARGGGSRLVAEARRLTTAMAA